MEDKILIVKPSCAVCGCHRVHYHRVARYHLYLQCCNCGFDVGVYDDDPSATDKDFREAWNAEANLSQTISNLMEDIKNGKNVEENKELLKHYSRYFRQYR